MATPIDSVRSVHVLQPHEFMREFWKAWRVSEAKAGNTNISARSQKEKLEHAQQSQEQRKQKRTAK